MPKLHRYAAAVALAMLTTTVAHVHKPIAPSVEQPASNSAAVTATDDATNGSLEALANTIAPVQPDRGCPNGRDDRTSDLCAQWKAADAAAEGAGWAGYSFYLAIGGLVVGTLTLGAAMAAAGFARDAARETKRAADEARRSADSAVKANQSSRAWIVFTGGEDGTWTGRVEETNVSNGHHFSILFKNAGQTPAIDVRIASDWSLVPKGRPTPKFDRKPSSDVPLTAPQGVQFRGFWFILGDNEWEELKSHRCDLIIYVKILYSDVFSGGEEGTPRRTTEICFRAAYTGSTSDGRAVIDMAADGPQNIML